MYQAKRIFFFFVSQFAVDTSLYLDGSDESFREAVRFFKKALFVKRMMWVIKNV